MSSPLYAEGTLVRSTSMDLQLKNISKSFSGVHALKNVDFEANFGEIRALLGENGAGKSTLIKILSGSLKPDTGEIYLEGKKLDIKKPKDAFRQGIATVYQELSLSLNLSVAHNVFLNSDELKFGQMVNKKDIERRTQELLDKYEIEGVKPTDLVRDLGLPYRQMIEIIKAIAKDPKVVILDEATSSLSEDRVEWLLKMARKMADEGRIVIFISHRMAEIFGGCDNVTVFRNGENVGSRKLSETNADELVTMMLGRRQEGYYPERIDHSQDIPVLEVKGLELKKKLTGIDLTVRKGEVMGVGGLAGQGQAELFQTLSGVLNPTAGKILIEGKAKQLKNPTESIKQGIALIPEDRGNQGLVLPQTIRENITLPVVGKIRKFGVFIDRKKEEQIIEASMKQLKIKAEDADVQVMTLSGGNQQKVVFAKMFAADPKVFLLYDCTRGVDVGTKAEIFNLVRDLAEKGNALLYYSSDVEELTHVCDRVAVMCDGNISAILSGEDITKENIILASVGEKVQTKDEALQEEVKEDE